MTMLLLQLVVFLKMNNLKICWSSYCRGTCYTDSSHRTKTTSSISPKVMDLHTDVADLEAKESFLDRMIEGCRTELKTLTEDPEVIKYPFMFMQHFCVLCASIL